MCVNKNRFWKSDWHLFYIAYLVYFSAPQNKIKHLYILVFKILKIKHNAIEELLKMITANI